MTYPAPSYLEDEPGFGPAYYSEKQEILKAKHDLCVAEDLLLAEETTGVPSDIHDKIEDGLLDFTLNHGQTLATGEEQAIDFGDFAPSDAYHLSNVFVGLINYDMKAMLTHAHPGSIPSVNHHRLSHMLQTADH